MTPEQLAQGQLEAYNAQNLEVFLSFYHNDVEIYYGNEADPKMTGLEAMRAAYGDLFRKFPKQYAKLTNRMVQGNYVVDQEEVSGRGDDLLHAVATYEVLDKKIRVVRFFI